MTETNATISFPPGRYGRRRDPRRRGPRWLPAALLTLVVLAGLGMAYQLNQQYGPTRPYHPTVERFYDLTDDQVVVQFTVRIPEGEAAICAVRARAADGREVGREEVRIDPPAGVTRPRITHRLATDARPTTGEVQRCWRAD
ncbi:MAG TPA: DUF4307 domain-containing protein [Natronosporangium sp.]